jgi:hypothetical protein
MTFGAPDASGPPARATIWLLVATFGLAACLTLVWLGMRAVMDVGGACADGGPYVSAQPCPEGVGLLMMLGIFGLFGFGGLGLWAGAGVGGPWIGLPLLAWPALFLSLGWNFLEYGVAPPEPFGDGPELGWLIPGVIFVLMGGVPLIVVWRAREVIQAEGSAATARRFGLPTVGIRSQAAATPPPSMAPDPSHRSGPAAAVATADMGEPDTGPADLVDRLERLARLRRAGDITNAEYEAAKTAIIGGAGEGS